MMRQTLKSIQNERSYAQKEFNGWESMAGRPAHSDFISQIDKDIFYVISFILHQS